MSLELKGKLIHVGEVQTFDSGFKKRIFVIETDEKYPQQVPFELFKDSCDMIDSYELNAHITVQFNVRGNEYNGRYFSSLNAWKIAPIGGVQAEPIPAEVVVPESNSEVDEIPF